MRMLIHRFMSVIKEINKPVFVLLTLFCLNMGYCALYKITSKDVNNKEAFTKQPKSLTNNSVASACSLTEVSTKIFVAEIERSAATDFSVLGLLIFTFIVTTASVSSDILKLCRRYKYTISPVPLFLQHRRLII